MQKRQCCQSCVYAVPLTVGEQTLWVCTNKLERPGQLTVVNGADYCSRFWKQWSPPVRKTPPKPPNDKVRYIALTQGKFAIVDAEDYERVNRYKWCVSASGRTLYAYRRHHGKSLRMHQFIMNPPKGKVVDHIDGNGLNNCKSNLRVCTQQQNLYNSRPRGKSSRFKGVFFDRRSRKWCASIQYHRREIPLGMFDDEVEAARAYDRKAYELFGEYAYLNFPEEIRKKRKKGKAKGQK